MRRVASSAADPRPVQDLSAGRGIGRKKRKSDAPPQPLDQDRPTTHAELQRRTKERSRLAALKLAEEHDKVKGACLRLCRLLGIVLFSFPPPPATAQLTRYIPKDFGQRNTGRSLAIWVEMPNFVLV